MTICPRHGTKTQPEQASRLLDPAQLTASAIGIARKPIVIVGALLALLALAYQFWLASLPSSLVQAALDDYQLSVSFDDIDFDLLRPVPQVEVNGLKVSYDDSVLLEGADFITHLNAGQLVSSSLPITRLALSSGALDLGALWHWYDETVDVQAAGEKLDWQFLDLEEIMLDRIHIGYFTDETALVLKGQAQATFNSEGSILKASFVATGEYNGLPSQIDLGLIVNKSENLEFAINELQIGESDLQGSLQLSQEQDRIKLTGELSSELLQLGELAGVDQPLHGSAGATQHNVAEAGAAGPENKLFSGSALGLSRLNSLDSSQVHYQIHQARIRNLYATELDLLLTAESGQAQFILETSDLGGGSLRSVVDIDAVKNTPKLDINTILENAELQDLLAVIGDEDTARGSFSGRAEYRSEGDSTAALASQLSGELLLLTEGGLLDAMLVELAGIDFAETIALLIKRDIKNTKINCGLLVFSTEHGKSTIEDLLIDTEDTVFLGEGYIDLNTEKMNVLIKPHPRDASLFSAPTPIRISGPLAAPSIKPAKSLYARLAAAAALATTSTPIAALLPFMNLGSDANEAGCVDLLQ